MPWWIAAIGLIAVAVAAAVTTVWLLSIAGHDATLRIEAIKVGLSVGAGTGGAVALLLAVRRQWLSERTQAHAEDVARATQAHAEAVARDNAYDATQRRVTELYGKAVEQLGHANAAVRLGGLYSLERLAQDHREHRQTVVDVVCAYLRMPFQPPSSASASDQQQTSTMDTGDGPPATGHDVGDARQELQVRLAAQRLLARHLALPDTQNTVGQSAAAPESYWADMRIDLSGAYLMDFDFSRCQLYNADFRGAQFGGDADFRAAQFTGDPDFRAAQFNGDAEFGEAQFSGGAGFWEAEFSGKAGFWGIQFSGDVEFDRAQFNGYAAFGDTQFNGDASFGETQFSGNAVFMHTEFSGDAVFEGAQFSRDALFGGADFSGNAVFERARFGAAPDFKGAMASQPNDKHSWPDCWQVEPSSFEGMASLVRLS